MLCTHPSAHVLRLGSLSRYRESVAEVSFWVIAETVSPCPPCLVSALRLTLVFLARRALHLSLSPRQRGMQSQANVLLRRLLPNAGSFACGLQGSGLACAGGPFSNANGSGQGSLQSANISSASSRDEESQNQPTQPAFSVPSVSSTSVRPNALRMASLLSCSPSSSSCIATPFAAQVAARQMSTLGQRNRALPLLPGMGGNSQMLAPKINSAPIRSFYTEGEVFGTVYMFTTNFMFWSGIIGAAAFRRNLIVLMLSSEIVMLACNMNFLFASAYLNDITGVIMSITITTIAACETAIGLALSVAYFHMRSAIDVESLNLLK